MDRILTGPVELSEIPTPGHKPPFVGTMLRFAFQAKKVSARPPNFPEIRIRADRIQTLQPWQQHEVRINGFLIGTIKQKAGSGPTDFVFRFQPRILRIDASAQPHDVKQENVNYLSVELGSGGFGLNDSFDIESIAIDGVDTNF